MTELKQIKRWIAKGCNAETVPACYDDAKYLTKRNGFSAYTDTELAAMRQFEHNRAEAYAKRVAGTPELYEEAITRMAASIEAEEREEVDEEMDAIETRIYEQQFDLIYKEHGERAANIANYGWGVGGAEDVLSVSTKVYGHGVLTSTGRRGKEEIEHEWRS